MKTQIQKSARHFGWAAVVGSLAIALGSAGAQAAPFGLLVTQSPPGPANQNPANWQGVLQYSLQGSGGAMTLEAGIDKSAVADPAGLGFRAASSEVFVGNRHGNVNASSISRFFHNPATHALTANGTITGNGLYGVHQIAFNPVTGEMFAANVNNGVSRFTFDTNGTAVANGTISSGPARGVAVSPDGARLYVSGASSSIRQFDLATGSELPGVTVPSGVGGLHNIRFHAGLLYVAALFDDLVYRYTLGAGNNLTLKDSIAMNDPVAIAFSPDGQEMFVSGHRTSDLIYRFQYGSQSDQWTEVATLDAGSSLGDLLVIPGTPRLAIARTAMNTVVVSWPLPDTGWKLQATTNLSANPIVWTEIAPPYPANATDLYYVEPLTADQKFYRLHKP